jgi:hypothetical protein
MCKYRRSIALLIVTTASFPIAPTARQIDTAGDDVLIYEATITHTIWQRHDLLGAGSPSSTDRLLRVADNTLALCSLQLIREFCFRLEDIERGFKRGVAQDRVPFERIVTPDTLAELMSQFASRNAERRVMPMIAGTSLIALEELLDEQARMEVGQRISYAAFSAPAYSSDGRALVYATYYCGALCGYGWIFLMEKSDARWRVRGVNLLWIS